MLINGEWHKDMPTFPVFNPATGEEIGQVADGTEQDAVPSATWPISCPDAGLKIGKVGVSLCHSPLISMLGSPLLGHCLAREKTRAG